MNDGFGNVSIDLVSGNTLKPFSDLEELVKYAGSHFPGDAHLQEQNVQVSIQRIRVRTSSGSVLLNSETMSALPVGMNDDVPASISTTECTANAPPPVPKPQGRGRGRGRPRKVQKTEPPKSPARVVSDEGYDIAILGGNAYEISRIHAVCERWDADVVNAVIQYGGRPPLVGITGGTVSEDLCSFRAPNGDIIHNVNVLKAVMTFVYGCH
jgi:hypothetical protein